MRPFLPMMLMLFLAAATIGCGYKSSANGTPPAGVVENPNRPDPEAIKARKPTLVDPQKGTIPPATPGKR